MLPPFLSFFSFKHLHSFPPFLNNQFRNPRDVAVYENDGQVIVYVADTDNHRVRKIMQGSFLKRHFFLNFSKCFGESIRMLKKKKNAWKSLSLSIYIYFYSCLRPSNNIIWVKAIHHSI